MSKKELKAGEKLGVSVAILYVCPLLWTILSCSHLAVTLEFRKDRIDKYPVTGDKATPCQATVTFLFNKVLPDQS
jgi:hypothetical protein